MFLSKFRPKLKFSILILNFEIGYCDCVCVLGQCKVSRDYFWQCESESCNFIDFAGACPPAIEKKAMDRFDLGKFYPLGWRKIWRQNAKIRSKIMLFRQIFVQKSIFLD